MLEFLYDNGMTHGHINANSLRISDNYTFTLSDFPISTVTNGFAQLDTEDQAMAITPVRGFHKQAGNSVFREKLEAYINTL